MPQNRKRGFTLIELLVVIAIIAILAAILFPVFAQAKNAAKKAGSMSNMKQIGLALRFYWDDWDGMSIKDTDWSFPSGPVYIPFTWSGWIQPYIKSEGLWKAPGHALAAESWTILPQNPDLEYANKSYGISVYGHVQCVATAGSYPDGLGRHNVDGIKNPSDRIVVYEVRNNMGGPGGDNAWWVPQNDWETRYDVYTGDNAEINRLAFRYNDGMNTLRVDTSVKFRKKTDLLNMMDSNKTPRARGAGDCKYTFYREVYYPWSADMSCTD